MRDIDQLNITQAVKDSFRTEPGSRLGQLLDGLIDHLHAFTREHAITHEEWMAVLTFLYDCGQISTPDRHEFILLSDVLGWSALVDLLNTRPGATEGSNLGPFYLDDAPAKRLGADLAEGRPGARVLVRGRVTDTSGNPLPGAMVDTWQAGTDGTYPLQQQGQDKYDLRGKFTCDGAGRYYYTTVLPRPYSVPDDGPVGDLLRAGKRHAWRTAHLHYIISAPGMSAITTELFFEDTDYIDADAVFGVRKSLMVRPEPVADPAALGLDLERPPETVIEYDFTLAPVAAA